MAGWDSARGTRHLTTADLASGLDFLAGRCQHGGNFIYKAGAGTVGDCGLARQYSPYELALRGVWLSAYTWIEPCLGLDAVARISLPHSGSMGHVDPNRKMACRLVCDKPYIPRHRLCRCCAISIGRMILVI